ncbi:UBX domain-containing protein 7 [Caerostris darwini]|uniref:UBX domain-containing protein 7 n=1 Tax=Caerostris darwini TaxID=1538125 RepID=A0AAV4V5D0_9ARAC|nr:UBX domain-containing protein 7 [Caerostris darwini]
MASTSSGVKLPEQNSDLIEQFCAVTGANAETANKMLEVCNWNLEMAVNMHVDSDFQASASAEPPVNGITEDDIRAPIPQSRAVLVEDDISFHYGLRGRKRRPHSVFDAFRDFQAEAQLEGQNAPVDNNEYSKKRRTLEDLYRPPLDLMHRGNFNSARDQGQRMNKWLMVNLQDSQEFACQVLNRDVWSNRDVKKLVSDHFIFWQVYTDSADGEKYSQFYKPEKFPYIAILDPRTGEKLVVWNNVDPVTICELIEAFLKEHSSPDGTSQSANKASDLCFNLVDQSEEEQLRAAIEASVKDNAPQDAEDSESDLESFDSDTESAGGKIFTVNSANCNSDHSNDIIDVVGITEINDKNPSQEGESWKDFLGSENDPKSNLLIRLPDGKKEQITWPCTTKLKSLLLYVAEIGFNLENYELLANFPRRNLCQLDLCKSLKEVDLFPREMIIVQLKA